VPKVLRGKLIDFPLIEDPSALIKMLETLLSLLKVRKG